MAGKRKTTDIGKRSKPQRAATPTGKAEGAHGMTHHDANFRPEIKADKPAKSGGYFWTILCGLLPGWSPQKCKAENADGADAKFPHKRGRGE